MVVRGRAAVPQLTQGARDGPNGVDPILLKRRLLRGGARDTARPEPDVV